MSLMLPLRPIRNSVGSSRSNYRPSILSAALDTHGAELGNTEMPGTHNRLHARLRTHTHARMTRRAGAVRDARHLYYQRILDADQDVMRDPEEFTQDVHENESAPSLMDTSNSDQDVKDLEDMAICEFAVEVANPPPLTPF